MSSIFSIVIPLICTLNFHETFIFCMISPLASPRGHLIPRNQVTLSEGDAVLTNTGGSPISEDFSGGVSETMSQNPSGWWMKIEGFVLLIEH